MDYPKVLSHWAAPGLLGLQAAGKKVWTTSQDSKTPATHSSRLVEKLCLPFQAGFWGLEAGPELLCLLPHPSPPSRDAGSPLCCTGKWRSSYRHLLPPPPVSPPQPRCHPHHCKSDQSTVSSHFPSKALGFHYQELLMALKRTQPLFRKDAGSA